MKILTGLAFFYAVFYIRTLWCRRTEESVNDNTEHIDIVTKTDETNITNATNETKTVVKNNVTEISNSLKKNNTVDASVTEPGLFEYANLSKYEMETRMYYFQLSIINKSLSNYNCTEKHVRFPVPESCDEYIECKNGSALSLQCLNGLNFDPESSKTTPCQYSIDVPCLNLTPRQYYLGECPHEFGYFKIEDKYNCSSFRICEFGTGYDFECPNGLAFRSDNFRCDWPHKVPECDAEAYADFQCPDKTEKYKFYSSPTDCQVYYTCVYGVPRRQSCGKYMGFVEDSGLCEPADRVERCDPHLALLAKADRRLKFQQNRFPADYDDGDGYFQNRNADLSFFRRIRKPKVISFTFHY